jgi:pimeloyl-ACP methyl ester carboxylesterase
MAAPALGNFVTDQVPVAGTRLHLLKGGQGQPCLVLHGIEGPEGWLGFHEALARRATVYAPSHPGYGHTEAPAWISSIAHQAVFYHWFLQDAGLANLDLVGLGVGGWIAAQMAVMCPDRLRHLVLVDAAGIRPERGEILDIFTIPWREVIEQSFFDATTSAEYQRIYTSAPIVDFGGFREAGRTMSMRMCFRPYMYDPALPDMLGKVRVPTLIVWGQDDHIVPTECAFLYQRAIPGAEVRLIDQCGHFAHLDRPDLLAEIVAEFVSR